MTFMQTAALARWSDTDRVRRGRNARCARDVRQVSRASMPGWRFGQNSDRQKPGIGPTASRIFPSVASSGGLAGYRIICPGTGGINQDSGMRSVLCVFGTPG